MLLGKCIQPFHKKHKVSKHKALIPVSSTLACGGDWVMTLTANAVMLQGIPCLKNLCVL